LTWYLSAIVAALFYAAQMLGLRRLQRSYPIPVYMAYIWLGAGALIGLFFIRSGEELSRANWVLVLGAALGSWAGMYAVNRAIRLQPNLGYIDAVGTLRLGLIYVLSIALFGAIFEPLKLLALLGIAAGVTLIVGVGRGESQKEGSRRWVMWQLFAVLCFTLLFGCVRMATASGADARVVTALVMLTAGMLYVASAIRNRQPLYPSNDRPMILLTIAASAIGNIAFFTSLASAPNLAYTDAIVNLRLVILYIVTLIMGADRLDAVKALGIALTFGCAALLS
jgi:drug/metabolite transporter (DMT)-like permease